MKTKDHLVKGLLVFLFIALLITGCVPSTPERPSTDPCLGLHTMGHPDCRPPTGPAVTNRPKAPRPTEPPNQNKNLGNILLDDFMPQPYQEESIYFYNRLGGDRGSVNNSVLDWGQGYVKTAISSGNSWGGVWMSLNHPISEGIPINFSEILPSQISPTYQSQIIALEVLILDGTPGRTFRLELKEKGELRWKGEIVLKGGPQIVSFNLPVLKEINEFLWVLDNASPNDFVTLDQVSFTATTQITDTATKAFVWSYGMLLNNWNPTTGLVRDKAKDPSGEFDAIQATGSLAAATTIASQLGIISYEDAVAIVEKIGETLLTRVPRLHGLWPHWVTVSSTGELSIVPNTEWSSVDTVIAAIGLLTAQNGLNLNTSETENFLLSIDWDGLVVSGGISHGYTFSGDPISYAWDVFGGESWLVELAYASVTGRVIPLTYPSPPTANGSGFIDELAWLLIEPPFENDYWGTDWADYRRKAAEDQVSHYDKHQTRSCFYRYTLFGLSAAEVPDPSLVSQKSIYQAFGVEGRFAPINDGTESVGISVFVPHYSAMVTSVQPQEAIAMWTWLIEYGYFSPLNNVESGLFPRISECETDTLVWNHLKGSWNLSLQTLGWGRYLAEQRNLVPILWQATTTNPLLRKGYLLLVPNRLTTAPSSIPPRDLIRATTEGGVSKSFP